MQVWPSGRPPSKTWGGKLLQLSDLPNSLPEFLDLKLFGKTILVETKTLDVLLQTHSGSEPKPTC